MKTNQMTILKTLSSIAVIVMSANAAPYVNFEREFQQPDGQKVMTIVNGDEYYQRVEDLNGRTLTYDSDGWIRYAQLNADSSEFIPGEVYTGQNLQVRAGEPLHLELKPSVVWDKTMEAKRFYHGEDEVMRDGSVRQLKPIPVTGDKRGIVILIDFPDIAAQVPQAEVEAMINGATGKTAQNYFTTVSGGKLNYTNQVVKYYRAQRPFTYYDDQNVSRTRELLKEVLDYLDANAEAMGVDFSKISNTNKTLTAVNFFYAGESKVWAKGLWPHMSSYSWTGAKTGYRTSTYQITGLTQKSKNIGTFCHENGHMLLKYPDLYPYTGSTNWVGSYCLMSGGGHGSTPIPPNPYFRKESGWLTYEDITTVKDGFFTLKANDQTRALLYKNSADASKFFVLEAIEKTGQYAQYAPGNGLICWKVNTGGENTQAGNNNPLVQVAGGTGTGALMANRPNVAFDATTTPAATWPLGGSSGLKIEKLSAAGPAMTFNIGKGVSLVNQSIKKVDLSLGMQNGKLMVTMPTAGKYTLQLFGINGRVLHQISGSVETAGVHESAISSTLLPSGMFLAQLETSSGSLVQKINNK